MPFAEIVEKAGKFPDELEEFHPFVVWLAGLLRIDALDMSEKDIFLNVTGGKRFIIGYEDEGTPVLGVLDKDRDAVMSIKWSAAALIKNVKMRDWLALSCKDIRVELSGAANPVPLRLWIPINQGILTAWEGLKPNRINIHGYYLKQGRITLSTERPLASLPLTQKGAWRNKRPSLPAEKKKAAK